ncbi:MAG: hypothetical protein ABFS35_20230 [Bacteroidota bacterium]
MELNRYFNFKRFFRLFRQDILLNYKTYGYYIAGIAIALLFVLMFGILVNRSFNFNHYLPIFIFFMLIAGVVGVTTAFPLTKTQTGMSSFLLQPASHFEKFMVQFIVRIVILFPFLIIIFWIDAHLAKSILTIFEVERALNAELFNYTDMINYIFKNVKDNGELIPVILLSVFSIVSFAFAGSVYFNRYKMFKTLIAFGLLVFVTIVFAVVLSHIFYPSRVQGFELEMNTYKIFWDLYNTQFYFYVVGVLSSLFLLPFAFYKLKEKEV